MLRVRIEMSRIGCIPRGADIPACRQTRMSAPLVETRSPRFPNLCRSIACAAAMFRSLMFVQVAAAQTVTSLKVMTDNIFLGGATYGPLSRTVGVIQAAQADVIGIQEVRGSGQTLASALGF